MRRFTSKPRRFGKTGAGDRVALIVMLSLGICVGCFKDGRPWFDAGSIPIFGVSGRVTDIDGIGLSGISVIADGGYSAVTDAAGNFTVRVPFNWTGAISPDNASFVFIPASLSLEGVMGAVGGQNFVAQSQGPGSAPLPTATPSVFNNSESTAPGAPKTLTLTGANPGGSDLTFTIVSSPTRGTLSGLNNAGLSSATVMYTPPASGAGSDTFTFRATTASGAASSTGVFIINLVTPAPSGAPIAVNQVVHTQTNAGKGFSLAAMSRTGAALGYSVLSPPANGILSGTAPNLFYVPHAGFAGSDTVSFRATDSAGASATAQVILNVQTPAKYTPPVGIPMPGFGITQTVAGVHGSDSFYTHWVDPTSAFSTDALNANGSPIRPRRSIPGDVPAGSVVVIAGGTFSSIDPITSAGTAAQPVFYRGLNPSARPVIKDDLYVEGTARYVIIENIALDRDYESSGVNIIGPAHHIALRHCDVQDAQGAVLIYDHASNVVVYNNHIHDCGDLNAAGDVDDNGIIIGEGSDCWILDNLIRNCVGSGIVLNPGFDVPNATIHHCYIGRNQVHHVRQSGLWSKQSQDCVFSQNTVWSILLTNHTSADGIGFQYGPERLWILNNRVFDCEYGIRSGSNSVSNPGKNVYIIGNVLHEIHDKSNEWNANNSWGNSGICLPGGVNRFVHNNTIYNCDAGINCPGDGSYAIANNIIANVTRSGGNHIWMQDEAGNTSWNMSNNLIWQGGAAARLKFRNTVYTVPGLQASQAARAVANILVDPALAAPNLGDFHLLTGSQAIDTGLNMTFASQYQSAFGVAGNLDADGVLRPSDGNGDRVFAWDIGAIETP